MPRRIGLPSLYLAAAVTTAVTTAIPRAMPPASGRAVRPPVIEPTRPYLVTARNRAAARDLVGAMRWRVRRFIPGFATWMNARRHARGSAVVNLSIVGAGPRALRTAMARLARSGIFVVASAGTRGCRLSPTGETYSTRSPYLAGAATRRLELHPGANPSVLASWRKCTATRDTIRQNPSRAMRTGRP